MVTAGVALVSAAALPAAAASGTIRVGARLGEAGSEPWAFGGAYAGAVVGTGLVYLGSRTKSEAGVPFYVAGMLAIPAGAVVGYNLGTGRGVGRNLAGRFEPPGLTFTSVVRDDHAVEYGVEVQLAGLRF